LTTDILPDEPQVAAPARSTLADRAPLIIRVASHLAVWASVLVALGVELSYGWRPVGDNAAIASRAYLTFTTHPPVVGLLSTASTASHTVYGPGPLLFWLLAVPVRLDPVHGALWGSALLAGAVLSLAIEALWSARLWVGSAAIAFAAVDMFWLTPSMFENISWNAYFPIPFFVATLALAWLVASGRFGWWPVLVFTASVAAQSHLLFSIPCTAIALVAPVIGRCVGGRPARFRWLWLGFGVAIICWIAPVLQQLFGRSGNVSAMVGSQSGQAKLGLSFALSTFGRIGLPFPIWLTHQPITIYTLGSFETWPGSVSGIVVLILLAAVAGWAVLGRRRTMAALAGVCLVTSVAVVIAYAIVPTNQALDLYYLLNLLWPLGIAVWATVIWAATALLSQVLRRRRNPTETPAARPQGVPTWHGIGALLAVAFLAVAFLFGVVGVTGFRPAENTVSWNTGDAASIVSVTAAIEHTVPRGPVMFALDNVSGSTISTFWISEGVGLQLRSDGWSPGLTAHETAYTGLGLPDGTNYTLVTVTMDGSKVASVKTSRCQTGYKTCASSYAGTG
jgi:hypothetical protein